MDPSGVAAGGIATPAAREGLGGVAEAVGAQAVAGAVELDDRRLEPGEVAHQVGPGGRLALGVEPALEVDLEAQGQEAQPTIWPITLSSR